MWWNSKIPLLLLASLAGFALHPAVAAEVCPSRPQHVLRFVDVFDGTPEDQATLMRFGEYKDALNLITRYPWFGIGFAGVPDIDLYIGVSSVYLLMAEEMGLVGLGAFVLIMLIFFANGWLAFRGTGKADPILLGALAGVLGALVGGLFDHYFFNLDFPHSVTLFWLFVGMAMAAVNGREPTERVRADDH